MSSRNTDLDCFCNQYCAQHTSLVSHETHLTILTFRNEGLVRSSAVPRDYHRSGRDGLVVDVGANIGQSLRDYVAVCSEPNYLGFEPNIMAASFASLYIQTRRIEGPGYYR